MAVDGLRRVRGERVSWCMTGLLLLLLLLSTADRVGDGLDKDQDRSVREIR